MWSALLGACDAPRGTRASKRAAIINHYNICKLWHEIISCEDGNLCFAAPPEKRENEGTKAFALIHLRVLQEKN